MQGPSPEGARQHQGGGGTLADWPRGQIIDVDWTRGSIMDVDWTRGQITVLTNPLSSSSSSGANSANTLTTSSSSSKGILFAPASHQAITISYGCEV